MSTSKSTPTGEYLRDHRGYSMYKDGETSFSIWRHGYIVTHCGSAWSCICYIDELLSP